MFGIAADISLRIIAAAAVVGLVLVVLRVRSGAARHAAWSAVLLAMLTMPALTAVVPRVDVPVPAALALDFGTTPDAFEARELSVAADGARAGSTQVAPAARPFQQAEPPARAGLDWRATAVAVYLAGVLFFFARIAGGWMLARRLVAHATRVSGDRVPVFESAAVSTPMTTGIVAPCIVLPVTWRAWPDDKREAVLAHEHAHVRRHDALVAVLAHVNRAIFWFHPLAWWLQRTLAVTAEHACDEIAARDLGHPRRYAEVLLDMAEAVRLRGHRVSWPMIGVDGAGLLGTRIDRLLNGDAMARMSGMRRAGVAAGCAAALVLAIACRQQLAAEALRPDPGIQQQIDSNKAREERHRAAVSMTVADAAALEKALETNPSDVEAREKLIIFYEQAGKVSWEEKLAGMRRHGLWRIANLPDTDLWIPNISKKYDPQGYAEAKRLWLQQTGKPDVTAKTLGRAAAFFRAYDTPEAETLLLRALQMEPDGPWMNRLGDLYAGAIIGSIDPRYRATDPEEANSPFAAEARRKLEAASDVRMMSAAGNALVRGNRRPDGSLTPASELGRTLLERALALDPGNIRARSALVDLAYGERSRSIALRLRETGARDAFNEFSDATYAAIAALPDDDRLFYLPGAASSAYMRAESIAYTARSKPEAERADGMKRAEAGFARARQLASDAVALAKRYPEAAANYAALYNAETVLGVLAIRDGDRKAAVEHMRAAADARVSDAATYLHHFGLQGRLVEYLLRAGEREPVAAYLEKSAERFAVDRERLLKDAAQIRAGVMPLSYQYAEARR